LEELYSFVEGIHRPGEEKEQGKEEKKKTFSHSSTSISN
jgi:hypothetical protein